MADRRYYNKMINSLKRLNTDQILSIAIVISVVLHFVFFIIIYYQPNENLQSSFGNGQVILLENMTAQPTKNSTSSVDTVAASKNDVAPSPSPSIPKGIKLNTALSEAFDSKDVKSPDTKNQTSKSTSNKGMAFNQSGIDPTPQQQYRQLVTQHLLTKVKSSRSTGKAIIHLNILKVGIATYVKIELLEGPKSYQTWLKRQVLNANPFPVIPKHLGIGNITLAIQLSNTTDI
jgi:hypothetical protein